MAARAYLARYSGRTLHTYTVSLDMFFRFMLLNGVDPIDATRPQIQLFVNVHLIEERELKASSVHHHIIPVRGFFKFAQIDDVIAKNPAIGVFVPKVFQDDWQIDWLNKSELLAMLDAAERSPRPSDHGLIALLGVMGLRISEALSIRIEDYEEEMQGQRVLRLIRKGGKPATIPVPDEALPMFDHAAGGRTRGPLLIRAVSSQRKFRGGPVSYTSARRDIARLAKAAGIDRVVTPHAFRRGAITTGLDEGMTMRRMQIFAGHEDTRTTARYDRGKHSLETHAVHTLASVLLGPMTASPAGADHASAATLPGGGEAGGSIVDLLGQLALLRSQRMLTDAEFTAAKAKILGL